MYSTPGARDSVDSLSSAVSLSERRDSLPLHSSRPIRPSQRRGSAASSIHSIGGSLDTSSSWPHTVLESGQNAISTLLQPPIVRSGLQPHTSAPASSAHRPPTSKDIPPVTLTNIPIVDPAEFKTYLAQIGSLYDQLQRVKESEDEAQHHRPRSRHDDDDSHLKPNSRPSSRKTSLASMTGLGDTPTHHRRLSYSYGRRPTHGPAPLSTIPSVYFEEDFHLENPRTFDVVSERSEVVRPPPGSAEDRGGENGSATAPRKALATNAILQEKLSWYMDTVEMHLISSISTASTTFFSALGSLRELHSEAADSVEKIKVLRKELEALDEEIATSGMGIVQKRQRRENLQQLNDAVLQLKMIVDGVATIESLVEAGENEAALDKIDAIEMLIAGKEDSKAQPEKGQPKLRLRDLGSATALQGVNNDMTTLRFRIGKAFEQKFVDVLLKDIQRHVESVSNQEVLLRWGSAMIRARGGHLREPSAFPTYSANTSQLRRELLPLIAGLHRARHLSAAVAVFRDSVLREVRNVVRRPLPSSNDDDNESMTSTRSASTMGGQRRSQQEKSAILARNLRALEPGDAEELLTKIYISVTETLRRLTTQVKVLLDVTSSAGDGTNPSQLKSPIRSPPLRSPSKFLTDPMSSASENPVMEMLIEVQRTLDMANLLGQAVDVAQDKIVKVLRVRSEQSARLPLIWFLRYFTLNLYFSNECEAVSGRGLSALKNTVNTHIKEFITYHGDMEKQKLASNMDSDQWNAKDFGDEDTELLSQILECSTRDAPAWLETSKIWIPYDEIVPEPLSAEAGEPTGSGTSTPGPAGASTAKSREVVRDASIEGERFILPNSAILCLGGISRFLHLSAAIPSMTVDVAASLIAYLQIFNSRCTQLILGAGATRSAGLKNITTKHLALAANALSFIAMLIPHMREFVRRHAPGAMGSGGTAGEGMEGGPGSGGVVGGIPSVMSEFDKIRRAFQEHQNSIYDKLVEIMTGRAAAHCRTIAAQKWDDEPGTAQQQQSAYMETLCKETSTLHRVLTKHLNEGTVRLIMLPVFSSNKDQLRKAYESVRLRTEKGRERMLKDVDYLAAKLSKIDGFGDTADYLRQVVRAKAVEAPSKQAPIPVPNAQRTTSERGNGEGNGAENGDHGGEGS